MAHPGNRTSFSNKNKWATKRWWKHMEEPEMHILNKRSQSEKATVCMMPCSVLEVCTFLQMCPFLWGCPLYWHLVACSSSYDPLYFCNDNCDFSFFISNCIDLHPLHFFLMNLAKGWSILLIISKNQLSVSLIFPIVFFVSISFISALTLWFLSFY